jgi:GT2 family glycosyltransferase
MPGTVDLSIVVVSWNTRDLLAQCLASVLADGRDARRSQDGRNPTAEVIVVDNQSSDGSAAMVRQRFPRARLIENTQNVGFARANNQVFPLCSGRYVLLLNPDTDVHPGALSELVRFMDAHPRAGGAGARLVNADGTLQPSCHPAPTLARELWRLFHLDALMPLARYRMERWDVEAPRQVDVTQGACLILRRAALDNVGVLDEDYFIYSEEVDLCYRLRHQGWRIWWVPRAIVTHYGGQSTRQVAREMFLRLYQGKVLYFRKHYGPGAAREYKLILLGAGLARLAVSPLAWLTRQPERSQRLTLTGHYRRLIAALPSL